MKKLFLFVSAVALTVSLNSCSSDSGSGTSLSMKVGGVKKSFKTEAYSVFGTTFVEGYIGNIDSPTESIYFTVNSGTGANKISNFSYDNATDSYSPGTLTSDVTTNTASSVKGTFSATLGPDTTAGADVVITEGTFSGKVLSE
jgi:hypothetical protein